MQSYQGIQHSCSDNFNRPRDSLCLALLVVNTPSPPRHQGSVLISGPSLCTIARCCTQIRLICADENTKSAKAGGKRMTKAGIAASLIVGLAFAAVLRSGRAQVPELDFLIKGGQVFD